MSAPKVTVIIVSYNTAPLTRAATESALRSRDLEVEVWVVDNASTDGSPALLRDAFPQVHVVALDENVGFGRANNVAMERTRAPWVLLLNSDARLRNPGDLARLVDLLDASPDLGVVAPRLESPQGRLEYSARAFPSVLREWVRPFGIHKLLPTGTNARLLGLEFQDHGIPGDTDWITGACLLVRRQVFDEVGGFDPAIFLFAEELEWCWRVGKAGWRIRLEPDVTVEHWGGASGDAPGTGKLRLAAAGEAYAIRRHRGVGYLALFTLARLVGLTAEAAIQGVWGAAVGSVPRRERSRSAMSGIRAWLAALGAGGSSNPSGPLLLGRQGGAVLAARAESGSRHRAQPGRSAMNAASGRGSVLYVTYDGLLEPLGASQIVPYVMRLRRMGVSIEILSFEKKLAGDGRREALAAALAAEGIQWTALSYHKTPTLPATAFDVLMGRGVVKTWMRELADQGRIGIVHARGYLPGLMGLVGTSLGAKLLFDMRGFWVDERIQGGYWSPTGLSARIGRWMERLLLKRSHHLILLTRRAGARIAELSVGEVPPPWAVVPTCVDLDRFVPAADKGALRAALGIPPGPVLLHIGTVTGWYDGRTTMEVGRAFVERTGGTFIVLSRDAEAVRRLADEVGVDPLVCFVQPEDVPRWLQAGDAGLALPHISSSKDASFPTKVAEYLACGLAVLATPIGDVPDFEDGISLRLLRGPGDIGPAVEWLARAVDDPARQATARSVAEARLGVDEGSQALVEVYNRLGVEPDSVFNGGSRT